MSRDLFTAIWLGFHLQYRSAFILVRRSSSFSCSTPSIFAFSRCTLSSALMRNFLSWNFWNFLLRNNTKLVSNR